MALDRAKMSQLHEADAAQLVGGERSKGSGSQWQGPADGRSSRMTNEYGWGYECKATCGQGIEVTRKIWAKIADQAEGERPLLMLRWYEDETFERVSYDLVAMDWADFSEIMADNASLRGQLEKAEEERARAVAAAGQLSASARLSPGTAAELVRQAQEQADLFRAENDRLKGIVSLLGLLTPAQRELGELGMPPRDLWPCTVIDVRPHDDPTKAGRRKRGWRVDGNGGVEKIMTTRLDEFGVEQPSEDPGEIRVDRGIGLKSRIFLNNSIVRRGEFRVNGVLEVQVRDDDSNWQAPPPPATDGIADTTG